MGPILKKIAMKSVERYASDGRFRRKVNTRLKKQLKRTKRMLPSGRFTRSSKLE